MEQGTIDKAEKKLRTAAAHFTASFVGVSLRHVNRALNAKEKSDSATAEFIRKKFREKLKQLQKAAAAPVTQNST